MKEQPTNDGAADKEEKEAPRYRGPRMTSEELRARLLRNAQRTDAAKAGVRCSVAFLACCCLSLGT